MPRRVAVAASGGRDSTALLHCTARAGAALGIEVVALHVQHGLAADAEDWLRQVRAQAARWGAGFDCRRLDRGPPPGASVEAWARRERYGALAEMAVAAGCGLVLLAHHRRDQAETWLLQALRGGGPRGLAAMPRSARRAGLRWARPWLDQPRSAIDAYLRRHRLRHAEDTSNADPRYARNALRLQVWPALAAAFPAAEVALCAAAARAQEAAALAAEAAGADLPPLLRDGALAVAEWLALPPARRRNALRAWLAGHLEAPVRESLVQRLDAELPSCRSGRWPVASDELRLYRGLLGVHALAAAPPPAGGDGAPLDLSRCGIVDVPGWQGHFSVEAVARGGAPAAVLQTVWPRPRCGGERFALAAGAMPRSLKKQYQSRAVPAWERGGPLLFTSEGRLLFVPGLGIDAALQAGPGQPQQLIRWHPGPAPGRRQSGG